MGHLHTPLHVLLFSTVNPPFLAEDERILARYYRLEKKIAHGLRALVSLPAAVARNDVIFTWFGSVYAGWNVFLARFFGKKTIIVVGGVDASKEPAINYGIWLTPWKGRLVRYAFRHADRVLAVDPSLQRQAAELAGYGGENIQWVPTGYDANAWTPDGPKERRVLVVASCENRWRMRKKGIDWLFSAARGMLDISFTVIGIHRNLLAAIEPEIPTNVNVIPYVPRDQLLPHYRLAKVYCQPSYAEGLPNTLCEAMLCGCIPVGTMVGGIPTAIANVGYLVPYGDNRALEEALRAALHAPDTAGLAARERIAREFPLSRREKSLRTLIDQLCASSGR